jgi:hypothetical protein
MKRLTTELTPKPVQILDCLTPCVQEQAPPALPGARAWLKPHREAHP